MRAKIKAPTISTAFTFFPEEAFILWSLSLSSYFVLQSFLQKSMGSIPLGLFALLSAGFFYRHTRFTWPKLSPLFYLSVAGLLLWVLTSGFIPWRDNDAYMFWMPKAKALALWGYLPAVSESDGARTLHSNYPLGYLGLSAFVHTFFGFFSPKIHQFTLMLQGVCVWVGLFRFKEQGLGSKPSFFWTWVFFALSVPQISIWANGYHDILWSSALALGLLHIVHKSSLSQSLAWLLLGSLGKMEGLVFLVLLVPLLSLQKRRFIYLWSLGPALIWLLLCQVHGWRSDLDLRLKPDYPLGTIFQAIGSGLKDLFLFRSFHGITSTLLVTALIGVLKIPKQFLWMPLLVLGFLTGIYVFSAIDPFWHVRFSLARVLLFPCLLSLFLVFWGRIERHRSKF